MKIIPRTKALARRTAVSRAWFYNFPEYELHYHENFHKQTETWHHFRRVSEILYIIEGRLTFLWKEKGKTRRRLVRAGDIIETGTSSHTFVSVDRKPAKLITLKIVRTGANKRALLRRDQVNDAH